ncbi:dihydrofolate reductase-like domain-containing protein [Cercophora samala]|uniref:2,5-diamino-6-ribosylamino-4(3H)-pyrimidinone 5'-phosphate reductase n=1 Tax=Cercophora samala TaxID=330535 RepID=A0AA39ZBI2_9PEZI|nr:dihydrofolate reductase-like domain-containing protein [Cercophora samala]
MPRLVRYNFAASLDGFIAAPSGSYSWIVDDKTIDFESLYAQFGYFLMGRKTHEIYQAMDPDENPLRGYYRSGRVVVVSDTLGRDGETQVEVVKLGEVESFVKSLKEREGGEEGDIWLMGGGKLAGEMLRLGLVDTVEVAVMPVVLGEGVKMFEGSGREEGWRLELREMERKKTGIVMLEYAVVYGDKEKE